jgi:large subunit ribosomal protein L29
MKINEIREMTDPELVRQVGEFHQERLKLKVQGRTGELKGTARIGQIRKDIARIRTEQAVRSKKASATSEEKAD